MSDDSVKHADGIRLSTMAQDNSNSSNFLSQDYVSSSTYGAHVRQTKRNSRNSTFANQEGLLGKSRLNTSQISTM